MPSFGLRATPILFAIVGASAAYGQRGGGDWMTSGNDAQRSSWVRMDAKISAENMQKPGFELLWKMKVNNGTRQLNALTPPALLEFYISYRGFRSLGFVGGSSDTLTAIDSDLGRLEWEKKLATTAPPASASVNCPGGMTSAVTRPTAITYPSPQGGRGVGRGTPAKSGVGEPLQGAITIRPNQQPPGGFGGPGGPGGPGGEGARRPGGAAAAAAATAAPGPFDRRVSWIHALSSDGKFHSLYVSNGDEPGAAVPFLTAGANAQGLIVFGGVAYAASVNNCGGVDNGIWALDIASKTVTSWKTDGNIAGTAGAAVGPDGMLYVATSKGELAALEPKTLAAKPSYQAGIELTSTPLVFEFKGKDLIAVTAADGTLHLADAANLAGGAVSKSVPFSAPGYATGALASWQDSSGGRWIMAPGNDSIVAFKVEMKDGKPALEKAWTSRKMVSPLSPIIINGVVFALSSGEFRTADAKVTAPQRAAKSSKAVLYSFDAATGKEFWNSGTTIASFAHTGGLSGGAGHVYLSTNDGTQYQFGFPIEH